MVTLSWETEGGAGSTVYIYRWTDRPWNEGDLGTKPKNCLTGTYDACQASFRAGPATHRFTLKVSSETGETMTKEVEITIPELAPVALTSPRRVSIDMFRPEQSTDAQRTISWTRTGTGYAQIYSGGSWFPTVTNLPPTGSWMIPATNPLAFGTNGYRVFYCEDQPPVAELGETNPVPFCSGAVPAYLVVEPSRFTTPSDHRVWVLANQPFDLAWTGSAGNGNFWIVDAPTLNTWAWTADTQYQIPAANMVPGFHDVRLVSAVWGGPWSNHAESYVPQNAPQPGYAHCLIPDGTLAGPLDGYSRMLRVTPDPAAPADCSGPAVLPDVDVAATDYGPAHVYVAEGALVNPGDDVAYIELERPPHVDHIQLIVGDPSPSWQARSIDADFADHRVYPVYEHSPSVGTPLDVYLDPDGHVWGSSEFGSALAHGLPDGTLTRHEVPLANTWDPNTNLFNRVMPYHLFDSWTTEGGGERVRPGGGYIWVPQGPDAPSYSRIMRFDPVGTDDPATEWDDRMCMYSLPSADGQYPTAAANFTNSLTWDPYRNRLWFTESSSTAPGLDWLDPAVLPCANFVDYSTPASIPGAVNRYCGPGDTDTSPCIHKISFSDDPNIQPDPSLQAVVDPWHLLVEQDAVWLNEWMGQNVVRYDIASNTARRFPPPKYNAVGDFWFLLIAGSSLAQIRSDANYVYFNEFTDSDIVRIHKSMLATPGLCENLDANGKNPCMDEIHLPTVDTALTQSTSWMDLDTVHWRAWFSYGQQDQQQAEATIGWVDVANWRPGVRYTGMGAIVDPSRAGLAEPNFGGISVDSASGKVAVTDYVRRQIVLLCPTTCKANATDVTPSNSTFELDANSDNIPDGWTKSGNGTVTLPTETFSGRAVKLVPVNTAGFDLASIVNLTTVPLTTSHIVITSAALTSGAIGAARVDVKVYGQANAQGSVIGTYTLDVTGNPGEFKRFNFESGSLPANARSIKVSLHAGDAAGLYVELDDLRLAIVN